MGTTRRLLYGSVALALALLPCRAAAAQVLYVHPDGQGAGTREHPASLRAAIARASKEPEVREIVLAGGEYLANNVNFSLGVGADPAKWPSLTIRPAEGEAVTLCHSVHVDQAAAVPGMTGVYRTDRVPPGEPNMWERDTRVRYVALCNKDSVAAHAASCFADPEDNALYLHTSDDKPPQAHRVFFGLGIGNGRALGIYRPNVTVQGLRFRDCIGLNTHAVVLNAPNLVVRGCHFDNCDIGCGLGTYATNNLVEDCTMQDVAQGVRSLGRDLTVRRCRFVKVRDRFLYRVYPALDTAVYTYFPASGTTIEHCFAQGYVQAFRVKAKPGKYVIRHNTIVDVHVGVYWVTDNSNSDTSYNVVVNAADFIRVSRFDPGFALDHNLFWRPKQPRMFEQRSKVIRGANLGKFNVLADPRFVDSDKGDYRLLPDSPALAIKAPDGRPAGAFAGAPAAAAAKVRPSRSLEFGPDTSPFGPHGEETFDRDPWIGGGTERVRRLFADQGPAMRLAGQPAGAVSVRAFDTPGKIVTTRVTVGGGPTREMPYSPSQTIELPDKDGDYRVRVQVRNDRGVWSEPVEAILRLDRQPPKLLGAPAILANDHGLIVTFSTDEPCFAEVQFGPTAAYGSVAAAPKFVRRAWESQDGGERVETWTIARAEHALAIIEPKVKAGQSVHLRVLLRDQGGLKSESQDYTTAVRGAARALFVSTKGVDAAGPGTRTAPFRTLQYAVDRALPGDRVVMMPGVYTRYTLVTHAGVAEDAQLTIEPEQPGTVTLDSAYREPSLIALEGVSYVTVRGLRILYYQKAGVYAYRSLHVTVDRCTFYNGAGSTKGYHVFMFYSPHGTVTRCLAVGGEVGLEFLQSPHATVTHNTISQGLYAAVRYDYSLAGTVQMNNSLCFAGNDIFCGCWQHPDELKTFRSDYNNLGTNVTIHNRNRPVAKTETWQQVLAEEFEAKYGTRRFRFGTVSKAILAMGDERYLTMKDWREASGQDKHSIFADPRYVKPYGAIDRWDWRLRPDSPNVGAGENRATLGALGASE